MSSFIEGLTKKLEERRDAILKEADALQAAIDAMNPDPLNTQPGRHLYLRRVSGRPAEVSYGRHEASREVAKASARAAAQEVPREGGSTSSKLTSKRSGRAVPSKRGRTTRRRSGRVRASKGNATASLRELVGELLPAPGTDPKSTTQIRNELKSAGHEVSVGSVAAVVAHMILRKEVTNFPGLGYTLAA